MMTSLPSDLPRLLYIGDVPVEASSHGSALLYRLLQGYLPEKLMVIEGNLQKPTPERRLPRVQYRLLNLGWERPLNSRFNRYWSPWLTCMARFKNPAVENLVQDFAPDAVLTVHHGYSWITAARFAERRGLPMHLILHDDWNRLAPFAELCRPWLDRQFGKVYRQAASRLCVSPYMAEAYEQRYGAKGAVLYPSRDRNVTRFERPPERLRNQPVKFTVAYAGNIFAQGYWDALRRAADVLKPQNGRLILFSPHTREQARARGLVSENVECRGFIKSEELIGRLREEADALFIPMSFDHADRANMEISFPSKLADSTIPGLPLLIFGPDYCSAVRWARENPGTAEVVNHEVSADLAAAFLRLAEPVHRWRLAEAALLNGSKYFSHGIAEQILYQALTSAPSLGRDTQLSKKR
jgi:glycosyltransferase involved in cell wall biosynthesis